MKRFIKIVILSLSVCIAILVILEAISIGKYIQLTNRFEATEVVDVTYYTVDHHTFAVRMYGDATLETIVLIHGFMGSSYDYHELSNQLKEDYYIIAIDLIGFGLSAKPTEYDYSKSHQAERVQALLNAIEIDRYILVGHSMGGEIALRLAYIDEAKIDKLILFASAGLSTGQPRALPGWVNDLVIKNYFIQRLGFNLAFGNEDFQTKERFEPMYYFNRSIPGNTIRTFSLSTDLEGLEAFIEEITIETLIIYGENDRITPPEIGERLDQYLPNSRLIILENIGHMPFIEALDDVLSEVRAFIQN